MLQRTSSSKAFITSSHAADGTGDLAGSRSAGAAKAGALGAKVPAPLEGAPSHRRFDVSGSAQPLTQFEPQIRAVVCVVISTNFVAWLLSIINYEQS